MINPGLGRLHRMFRRSRGAVNSVTGGSCEEACRSCPV